MEMSRLYDSVLVTGGAGYCGSRLIPQLLDEGYAVTVYDKLFFGDDFLPKDNPRLRVINGDIRDAALLTAAVVDCSPDYVFHLAAQSLVRTSYSDPLDTYSTNVMGTANVLNALRGLQRTCAAVFVTTDKCYENREWVHGYREEDALGGHDPYSSSKAAAEIAIASFRNSFFKNHPVRIASVRAGNVIGGGDWGVDRIVPDAMRALQAGAPVPVRNPQAIRPWQHVLDPLSGYLWLAARLFRDADVSSLCSAFNFGPGSSGNRTVLDLVNEILVRWPGTWVDTHDPAAVKEAGLLHLAIDKASALLDWTPVWSFSEGIARTVEWYRAASQNESRRALQDLTQNQISSAVDAAREKGLKWACAG